MSRKHKKRDRVTGQYSKDAYDVEFDDVNDAALKEIETLEDIDDGWDGGTFSMGAKTGGTTLTGASGTTTFKFKKCYHPGIKPFMELDGVNLAGAQGWELTGWEADLIIDLGNNKIGDGGQPFVKSLGKWIELEKYVIKKADVLKLNWTDQGVPPVGKEFWSALWAKVKDGGYKRVCVCCVGGHGRTGTLLAALLIVIGGYDDLAAVQFIHDNYCDQAVESQEQDKYLMELAKSCKER